MIQLYTRKLHSKSFVPYTSHKKSYLVLYQMCSIPSVDWSVRWCNSYLGIGEIKYVVVILKSLLVDSGNYIFQFHEIHPDLSVQDVRDWSKISLELLHHFSELQWTSKKMILAYI